MEVKRALPTLNSNFFKKPVIAMIIVTFFMAIGFLTGFLWSSAKENNFEKEKEQMARVQKYHHDQREQLAALRRQSNKHTMAILSIIRNKQVQLPDSIQQLLIEDAKFHTLNNTLYSDIDLLVHVDSIFLATYCE